MKYFFSFLGNLREYLIFSGLIIISLITIFQNENVQIGYIRAVAVSVIGNIQHTLSFFPNVIEIENENRILREKNMKLSREISEFKEAKLENMRLNQMLGFREAQELKTVSGKIIGKTIIQTRNNITIDRGENDSVYAGMPVITEKGLVGKVVAVSKSYSIAQILLNKDLKITAKNQRSRVDGIISWNGDSKFIQMQNVSKSSDVLEGDVIITSEYSNNFPPGIPIGYVVSVGIIDNLFKKIEIQPFVDFDTLEEVFIFQYLPDEERKFLEKEYFTKTK